ncbi:mitogen-activated protein kinase 15 [Mesoplodon densirostris]|uniref:mitogen-activated protein kinase 15 n=1 Tax=Mesoplodon densirostris TaxID=48708 RepID=UPI0028DD3949|nr:mitogen-activated protein kinase 15 [Mesoplodon densirostris]
MGARGPTALSSCVALLRAPPHQAPLLSIEFTKAPTCRSGCRSWGTASGAFRVKRAALPGLSAPLLTSDPPWWGGGRRAEGGGGHLLGSGLGHAEYQSARRRGSGGGAEGAGLRGGAPRQHRIGRGLGCRPRSAPPRRRRREGSAIGSQGNRFQQFEPSSCLEAFWRPPAGMCAAEMDRHVAQRYLLKRRLGKGVSSGRCPGVRRTRPPAGRGQGQSEDCGLPLCQGLLEADVRLPVHEGAQLSATEYRSRLYQMILERRGNGRVPRETGLGVVPTPPAPPLKPRAAAKLPSGSPARQPGRRPRSNPGHVPEHDVPGGAKDPPRQSSAPLHQPPPPGGLGRGKGPRWTTAGLPSASCWVKPSGRGAAPSLTSQAAAQVAVQALIRSDRNGTRAVRAVVATRVPPRPPRRPGRRMFSASASQEAQGAARAALGGYSQAYGPVCRSALGCLPLLPGPRA